MKIHSDTLTAQQIRESVPTEYIWAEIAAHGSRKRARGFDVYLEYSGPRRKGDGRKLRNSGNEGAKQGSTSATYDEHGEWMARLFEIDPDAIISNYDGKDDFIRQTTDMRDKGYRASFPWLEEVAA